MTAGAALTRGSATDRAYTFAKERVLRGDYPGGELISEGEVAAAVGVSRTPVREAFLRLAAEGLLRLYPKRGALVVPVSADEVRDVLAARLLVEGFAVDALCTAGVPTGLPDTLADLVATQRRLADAGDAGGFAAADRAFHSQLVAAAGNGIVASWYAGLRDRQLRMGVVHAHDRPGRLPEITAEHVAILDALRSGDAVAAREAVRVHLSRTDEALRGVAAGA